MSAAETPNIQPPNGLNGAYRRHPGIQPTSSRNAVQQARMVSGNSQINALGGIASSNVNESPEETSEDEEESEDESVVSEGDNLITDFEDALASDFDFSGTFAYGKTYAQAPNPCIGVNGLGAVGIPLSPRDALEVIKCSTQAPYGDGERTVVNKGVRDTWEIESNRVSFANPEWDVYMNTTIVPQVCKELGVAPSALPPKAELYKMLLYEAGSHFLPHQDTVKTPGMFATIVVILPSQYTGGQVHTSHSNFVKSFDFSSSSISQISVLAWYTDVQHEVKPVVSGYRWALSYNLVHTSPEIPPPVLPNMDYSQSDLAHVLRKWRKEAYSDQQDLVAYILDHKYSALGLQSGLKGLKGKDAHKVRILKDLADKQGFAVCLGNLKYHESGQADDCGGSYHQRRRRGYYGGYQREDTPEMIEVLHTKLTLETLHDCDGLDMVNGKSLGLEMEQIVPQNAFEGVKPDDTSYEGYMGNWSGSLDHYYRRTVVVVGLQDDIENICMGVAGTPYILQKLTQTRVNPPSPENLKLVQVLMRKQTEPGVATAMYDHAIFWKDAKLWNDVMNAAQYTTGFLGPSPLPKLAEALKAFTFDLISSSLKSVILKAASLSKRTEIIELILGSARDANATVIQQWAAKMAYHSVQSITSPVPADVPVLISIMKNRGPAFINQAVIPQLIKHPGIYDFWVTWLTEHIKLKAQDCSLIAIGASPSIKTDHETLLDQAFKSAFASCFVTEAKPNPSHVYYGPGQQPQRPAPQYADRVLALVALCIGAGQPERCQSLFDTLLRIKSPSTAESVFTSTYIPIIQQLKRKPEVDFQLPVFTTLLREIIFKYLAEVLGTKPISMIAPRHFGCGCSDCGQVTQFIINHSQHELILRLYAPERRHVMSQAYAAQDLVNYTTVGGQLTGLRFTKTAGLASHSAWLVKQNNALSFLKMIGDENELRRVMGMRFEDGIRAIQGVFPFSRPNATPVVSSATQSSSNSSRKRRASSNVVSVGVIDLTD